MKKSRKSFCRKLVKNAKNLKIGGLGQFGELPLTGPTSPIWPVQVIALAALRKTVFIRRESTPIWGRYGILKFSILLLLSRYDGITASCRRHVDRCTKRPLNGCLSICHQIPDARSDHHFVSSLTSILVVPNEVVSSKNDRMNSDVANLVKICVHWMWISASKCVRMQMQVTLYSL